ncbi:hypothetical protein D9M68_914510 [compost metagenome]
MAISLSFAEGMRESATDHQPLSWPAVEESVSHKDSRSTVLRTVYGKVTVNRPRLWSCACQRTARTPRCVVHPLSEALTNRATPELEYLRAKWASHLPYRQATAMLKEVLPRDKGIRSAAPGIGLAPLENNSTLTSSVTSRSCPSL